MMAGPQPIQGVALTKMSRKSTLHGMALLDNLKLSLGARQCLRGTALRNFSKAACTLRQRATLVRAGLAASTRRDAAHRSKAARVQATALKRHAPPAPLLTQMMTIGRTPRQAKESHSRASKCCSRGPRVAPSRKATQLVMLRAADREAQQVQRRSHRALILAQRRSQVTGSPPPAAQSCDKREDQTAGQAHTSSQGGLTGSEQGLRCLDITTETRLGRDHHTQRSRVAHAHAAAQRRNTHADELPTVASNSQHAPHRAQGHLSERSAQPGRLMAAAQKAELAHGRFYRASALLQKRDKLTGPSLATVEDVPAAAKLSLFSQPTQQQSLVQADTKSVATVEPEQPCASTAAAEEHTSASQKHMDPAQPQQGSTGTRPCAMQGRQHMGSPAMPKRAGMQESPDGVEAPATPQLCPPPPAVSAREALQKGVEDRAFKTTPPKALGATGQLGSSAGMPGRFGHGNSGSGITPCTPAQQCIRSPTSWHSSPQGPSQAAANRPASRLAISSSHALPPLSSEPLQCSGGTAHGSAISAGKEQPSASCAAPESQAMAPAQGTKELPHPLSSKGKGICRPDWRTGSPGKARAWLMYKKVFHRGHGGGADDFQTLSVELPTETLKKLRPKSGGKSLLALESRLEDDINIPTKVRMARYKRKRILKSSGGIAPQEGHTDYKIYRYCCKLCEKYY